MELVLFILFAFAVSCFSYVGYVLHKQHKERRQIEIEEIYSQKAEFNAKKSEASRLLEDLKGISDNLIVQLESRITANPNCIVDFPNYIDEKSKIIENHFSDEEIIKLIRLKSYINEIVNEHKRVYELGKTWEKNLIEDIEEGKFSRIISDLSEKEFMAPINYGNAYEIENYLTRHIKLATKSINDKKDRHSNFIQSIEHLGTLCSTLDDLAMSMVMMRLAKNKIGYLTIYNVFDRLGAFYDGYQMNTLKTLEDIHHGLIELRNSLDKIHLALDQISGELATVSNTLYNIQSGINELGDTGEEINSAIRFGNLLNTINLIQNRQVLKALKSH